MNKLGGGSFTLAGIFLVFLGIVIKSDILESLLDILGFLVLLLGAIMCIVGMIQLLKGGGRRGDSDY